MASLNNKVYNPYPLPARQKKEKKRIPEIDFMRGFDIVLMVLYHLALDFSMLVTTDKVNGSAGIFKPINPVGFVAPAWIEAVEKLGQNVWWIYIRPDISPLQIIFSSLFMFLCGVSCTFSRSNYKRGIELLFLGITMSVALDAFSVQTAFSIHIYLGIIQSLAIAIIIYAIFDRVNQSIQFDVGMALLFSLIYCASFGFDWNNNLTWATIPSITNGSTIAFFKDLPSFLLGYKAIGDDYFSPILTTMLVFIGAAFGKTFYKERKSLLPSIVPTKWMKPINWLGRHSLEAYILHQPVLYLLLWIILLPFGYTLA